MITTLTITLSIWSCSCLQIKKYTFSYHHHQILLIILFIMNSVWILNLRIRFRTNIVSNISLFSEIGGLNNSKIALRISETKREILPTFSHPVLEVHKPNKIRLTITHSNRILLFINNELKYDLDIPYSPLVKYLSFATLNSSSAEYYYNCIGEKNNPFQTFFTNFSIIDGALIFALIISFSINIITLFIIFIAWSTA